MENDCKVCKQLIKEKHRNMIWWKICCIIFAALTVILGVLYFGSGAVVTETEIKLSDTNIKNNGDNGIVIVGGNDNQINGTIEKIDYTPIICISVVACVAILVVGGILIANHIKKDD